MPRVTLGNFAVIVCEYAHFSVIVCKYAGFAVIVCEYAGRGVGSQRVEGFYIYCLLWCILEGLFLFLSYLFAWSTMFKSSIDFTALGLPNSENLFKQSRIFLISVERGVLHLGGWFPFCVMFLLRRVFNPPDRWLTREQQYMFAFPANIRFVFSYPGASTKGKRSYVHCILRAIFATFYGESRPSTRWTGELRLLCLRK